MRPNKQAKEWLRRETEKAELRWKETDKEKEERFIELNKKLKVAEENAQKRFWHSMFGLAAILVIVILVGGLVGKFLTNNYMASLTPQERENMRLAELEEQHAKEVKEIADKENNDKYWNELISLPRIVVMGWMLGMGLLFVMFIASRMFGGY